jgi:hypothetical protein
MPSKLASLSIATRALRAPTRAYSTKTRGEVGPALAEVVRALVGPAEDDDPGDAGAQAALERRGVQPRVERRGEEHDVDAEERGMGAGAAQQRVEERVRGIDDREMREDERDPAAQARRLLVPERPHHPVVGEEPVVERLRHHPLGGSRGRGALARRGDVVQAHPARQ